MTTPSNSLLGTRGWTLVLVALAVLTVLVPVLNLAVPAGSAMHLVTSTSACWARSFAMPSARWRLT